MTRSLATETLIAERDHWRRLFNRLDAAISHHARDGKALANEMDEELYAARDRIVRDAAEGGRAG